MDCYNKMNSNITYFKSQVKENDKREQYIEIVAFNNELFKASREKRFIIQKGRTMSSEDERDYIKLIKSEHLFTNLEEFDVFKRCALEYLDIKTLEIFSEFNLNMFLDCIYFSSHKSGVKEILYKAGFGRIAFNISIIEKYDSAGSSPERILDIPQKLIKIMYSVHLENHLYQEWMRNFERIIYKKYSDYFGKNNLPNRYQWLYLEKITTENSCELKFDKVVYKRLSECDSENYYEKISRFLDLSFRLGKEYSVYQKLPPMTMIDTAIKEMELIIQYVENMGNINSQLQYFFNTPKYSFENDDYIIIYPLSVKELVVEAVVQENCLISHIDAVISGTSIIVFLRKKERINRPYVTI